MSPRPWFVGLLAGIGLLLAAPAGRGQDFLPPLEPEVVGPTVIETARPMPGWYANVELAVLYTAATHYNERVFAVHGDPPEYVSPRLYLGRELEGGGAIRFTYRNLTQTAFPGVSDFGP